MKFWSALVAMTGLVVPSAHAADPITLYTEVFPPFIFEENGAFTGLAFDIISGALAAVEVPHVFEFMPSRRAALTAREQPNACVVPMTDTANDLETMFLAVRLVPTATGYFTRTVADGGAPVLSVEDLRGRVVVIGDRAATQDFLRAHDVPFQELADPRRALHMLAGGRIDVYADDAMSILALADLMEIDVVQWSQRRIGDYVIACNEAFDAVWRGRLESILPDGMLAPAYRQVWDSYGLADTFDALTDPDPEIAVIAAPVER